MGVFTSITAEPSRHKKEAFEIQSYDDLIMRLEKYGVSCSIVYTADLPLAL